MKKITKILSLIIVFSVASCGGNSEEQVVTENVEILQENVVIADYKIDGMVCAMGCAKTIEDEVGSMGGVTESNVDYESGKAHFEYDKSQITEEDIKAKIASIADGQYKVSGWIENEEVELEETENIEESATSPSDKVEVSFSNFEIPNLFTLIVKSL